MSPLSDGIIRVRKRPARAPNQSELPWQIDRLRLPFGTLKVVRDDLLPGGTKQRAAIPYLEELKGQGYREFVYSSPFCGFAQVALASACRELGLRCTIFAERDPGLGGTATTKIGASTPFELHALSRLAACHGADVVAVEHLPTAEFEARLYAAENSHRLKVPLGFDDPSFKAHLRAAIAEKWKTLPNQPRAVWVPVGSGTLAHVFREVIPAHVPLRCVNVRVLSSNDGRIQKTAALPGVTFYTADEKFHEPATARPPVPSNLFYDSKLWSLIARHGQDGDLWWNVAG